MSQEEGMIRDDPTNDHVLYYILVIRSRLRLMCIPGTKPELLGG
jgi:hypothetical protein